MAKSRTGANKKIVSFILTAILVILAAVFKD